MSEMLFDFDDLLYNVFQPEVEEKTNNPAEELIELNLVQTETSVFSTLTPLATETKRSSSPVSYSSLPPIEVLQPTTKLPTEMNQQAEKEQAEKDEIRRRRIRESAAKHRRKKLAQLAEMRAEIKQLTESITQAEKEQAELKIQLEQNQTKLNMMMNQYSFQPVQYQPNDCNQLNFQADCNHFSSQSLFSL